MAAQHAEPEEHQRAEPRRDEREQPERPREVPDQEMEGDVLGVLDHEDDEYADAGERGDRSTAHPGARARPSAIWFTHEDSLSLRWPARTIGSANSNRRTWRSGVAPTRDALPSPGNESRRRGRAGR